jgi:hypothetical protein
MNFLTKFYQNISNIITFHLSLGNLICMTFIKPEILIINNVFNIQVSSKDKNNYYRILKGRGVLRRNRCYWRGKQNKCK